jgi:hypothetical protein
MSVTFNPFTGNLDFNDTTKASGSDTQIQFNDGGKLSGDSGLIFNKTTDALTIAGPVIHPLGAAATPSLTFTGDPNTGIYSPGADQVAISTNGTGRLFVDANGRLLVGTTTARTSPDGRLQVEGVSAGVISLTRNSADAGQPVFNFIKTRGSSTGSFSLVQSGDVLGQVQFGGTDGSAVVQAADIFSVVDGVASAGDVPGRLVFRTASGGTLSERMRLDSSGRLGLGTSSPSQLFHVQSTSGAAGSAIARFATSGTVGLETGIELFSTPTDGTIATRSGRIYSKFDGVNFTSARTTLQSIDAGNILVDTLTVKAGRVGIGSTAAPGKLTVSTSSANPTASLGAWTDGYSVVTPGGTSTSGGVGFSFNTTDNIGGISCATPGTAWRDLIYKASAHRFELGSSEAARIDSSGRLLVGTSTGRTGIDGGVAPSLQIEGSTLAGASISVTRNSNDTSPPAIYLTKSRSSSYSVVSSGDNLGVIGFTGADGSITVSAATIKAEVDGTPGANDMPGRLVFSTTADGASSPTERMRIDSSGKMLVGTTNSSPATSNVAGTRIGETGQSHASADSAPALIINRKTNDGGLVDFLQDGTFEGSISVSGTTVSYNGAHLSRWSQLPGGAERAEILRGTVLSNIDEMCAWGEEENEQLNRMKVSDAEGDHNVSGVFQAWDDDDDTYTDDFYCAMTGDFIIRIAEDAVVQRGDLLMSAGDGTAKPQGDDIVRSKTIAKVTSTHVTCTYDDGSYCVPCVLMAC